MHVLALRGPHAQHRVHHAPGPGDLVVAQEQRLVAGDDVEQQQLVGVEVVLPDAAVARVQARGLGAQLQARLLDLQLHAQALHRLQVHEDPVRRQALDGRGAEELLRHVLEADGDERVVGRHALAGAQEERNAAPAPVVDVELERGVGLGGAVRRHPRLLEVARHALAADLARGVLGAEGVGVHRRLGDGADGAQHLDLLVAQRLGLERGRRLHRHQRQHLQQVALDHVAQGAGAVVVAGAPLDPARLGVGDLHVVDVVAVPQRLEQQVGEAEDEDVLYGALPEVMVDAVELVLAVVAVQALVERLGALEVVAEGLLDHEPPPAPVLARQPAAGDAVCGDAELARPDGEIEHEIGWEAVLETRAQALEAPGIGEVAAHEGEAPGEAPPHLLVEAALPRVPPARGPALDRRPHLLGPAGVVPGTAPEADDAAALREPPRRLQVVEGRQQLGAREVPGGAEDDEGAGVERRHLRPAPPGGRRRPCASWRAGGWRSPPRPARRSACAAPA